MAFIHDLHFSYGKKHILKGITLSLQEGSVTTLVGSSGSGKTTLLKVLIGLLKPSKGSISLTPQQTAYMMQEDLLLPWRTVVDNAVLPQELGRNSPNQKEAIALLKEMGLGECLDAYPDQLSGGMRQRVSLARTLLLKRPYLFLDEPFASLDVALKEKLYGMLRSMNKKLGITILMVSHDFRDALSFSDKIMLLDDGIIQKQWDVPHNVCEDAYAFGQLYSDIKAAF